MPAECIFCHGGARLEDVEAFETESGIRFAIKDQRGAWWTDAFKICQKHQGELNSKTPSGRFVEEHDAAREIRALD